MLHPLFLLAGCPTVGGPDPKADDTGDTGGDADDTGDITLPDCTPQAGTSDLVALSGIVLVPEGATPGHVVYSTSTGLVTCAGNACDTAGAEIVCTEGVVSPGLIDPHNHLQYNSLPPWQVEAEFDDRYEWQSDGRYWDYRTAYDEISSDYTCEIMKWAEARELIHGTTAAVGSSGGDCIQDLLRNLDENDASHLTDYNLSYSSGNVTDRLDAGDAEGALSDLADGSTDAVINHVAEGRNGSVGDEIDFMQDIGLVGPGTAFVHASDASTAQLAQMAVDGTAIIWSPRSNLALYATTTPIEIADRLGVPWAIGTDWTPSGSTAPIQELACAAEWLHGKGDPLSNQQLWEKATTDAARVVGLDGVLGQIIVGQPADLAVFDLVGDPYASIVNAGAANVRLVVIGGETVYGLADWVPETCETLDVCGSARRICADVAAAGATLEAAMSGTNMPAGYEYAGQLHPLFECEDTRDTCDLREPTADDADGDGIADGSDVCPSLYDPAQWNADGDSEGDVCDVCPLVADATECALTADDLDGDGILNAEDNCPDLGNTDQADRDSDLTGDACDACPDVANPGSAGCPTTIDALRNGAWDEGTTVQIDGAVVTARGALGFFVQEPTALAYGALYVFDQGTATVAVGEVVTVTGDYLEYYSLTELKNVEVVTTGTAELPGPFEADACALATDGEALESMLVRIENATVTDANPDDPEDYDEFEVDDCLRVDDLVWADLDQPAEGTTYASITGPLAYTFSAWKILPRDASDMPE